MINVGFLFTILSALLYGSIGFFGTVLREQGLSVLELCFWRFTASAFLLLPLFLMFIKKKVSLKHAGLVFFWGALFYSSSTYFYFAASQTLGTGLAMILFFTYPIYVVLIDSFQKKAFPSLKIWVSVGLIVTGCTLISFGKSANFDLIGICLALISAFAYSLYVAASKQTTRSVPPLFATFLVCLGNSVAFFIAMLYSQPNLHLTFSASVWIYILLFAIFGTVLPVLLLLKGMKSLSSSEASIISVLEPVMVLGVGYVVLNEPLSFSQALGAGIILISAVLVVFGKKPSKNDLL